MMSNFSFLPEDTDAATNLAFHILNTVDIPNGTSRTKEGVTPKDNESDFTQWTAVSDTAKLTFSVRMYESPLVYSVKLGDLNLESLEKVRYKIPTDRVSIDITENISTQ
jgi:choloylglycine hydrolase